MKNTRLISIENQPMMIYESPEIISDHMHHHKQYYEFDIFEEWKNYFPTDGLMLDIGANIGNHSLMFKNSFPNLEIWAFEPLLENFLLLKTNTKNFKDIISINTAVGSRTGIVNFDISEFTNFNNSGAVRISENEGNQNLLVALDDINFENKKITFVKLDVEGHELSCIEGMINIVKQHKPVFWIEDYIQAYNSPNSATSLLQQLGYEMIAFKADANYLLINRN